MTTTDTAKHGTNIRWTHGTGYKGETWNPLRGCTLVSPGCTHCYAMRVAARFSGPGQPYEGLAEMRNGHAVWTNTIRFLPEKLDQPDRWKKPRMVFVNSMSDLFHVDVPDSFIDAVFDVMERNPRHIFQVLTKRPERMSAYMKHRALVLSSTTGPYYADPPTVGTAWYEARYPHIWLGTSVEDQKRADERIPALLDTPAAVRFLSCEPLLGPLSLTRYLYERAGTWKTYGGTPWPPALVPRTNGLSWIIVGGESGPGYRFADGYLDAARSIRDQCVAAGVAFYHKQSPGIRTESGQLLDGERWEQYPRSIDLIEVHA